MRICSLSLDTAVWQQTVMFYPAVEACRLILAARPVRFDAIARQRRSCVPNIARVCSVVMENK